MNFKKSFCWRSNLSNDGVISVFVNMYVASCDLLQVWKWVWILEARSETGVKNDIFWSEMGSEFGESGGNPPTRIPVSTPPPESVLFVFQKRFARYLLFTFELYVISSNWRSRCPGGILGISSDGDDRMEPKGKTQKFPRASSKTQKNP